MKRGRRIILQTDQRIVLLQVMKFAKAGWLEGMGYKIEEVARDIVPIPITIQQTLDRLAETAKNDALKREIDEIRRKIPEAIKSSESMDEMVDLLKNQFEQLGIMGDLLTFFLPATRPSKGAVDPIIPISDKNGKIRWFQVDNDLYGLLEGLDVYRLGGTMDLLFGGPTRALRLSTTALRPVFALWRNPLKDFQTFIMHTQSDKHIHVLAGEWVATAASIVKYGEDSPYFAQFLRFGLEAGTQLGQDVRQTKRAVEGLFQGKWKKRLHNPIDTFRDLMSIPEMVTRTTELKLVAEKIGWKPGQPMTFRQSIILANAAKLASVDFTAAGGYGRVVNQMVPFFNANVQGNRQFYENMRDRPRRTMLWGLTYFTIPTLMLWYVNKDEEWFRDMPYWERYTYWNFGKVKAGVPGIEFDFDKDWDLELDFGNHIYQIPRAFEWGAIFSVMPEAIIDSWYNDDPAGVEAAFGHLWRTFKPPVLPPSLAVPAEIALNYNFWTGRPIVSKAMEGYAPGEQKGKYTSQLALWAGEIFQDRGLLEGVPLIGNVLGVSQEYLEKYAGSPVIVDHAIRGFFGGLGPDLLATFGLGAQPWLGKRVKNMVMGPNKDDVPVASYLWFERRGGKEAARSKAVDQFYEEWQRQQIRYDHARSRAKPLGELPEGQENVPQDSGWPETLIQRKYRLNLNDARFSLSMLNRLERATTDPTIIGIIRKYQRFIASDALAQKGDPPNEMEAMALAASLNDLAADEKEDILAGWYFKSQFVDNDPESIFAKAQALGIHPERVRNMMQNLRIEITILQMAKASASPEDAAEIDKQLESLRARQTLQRFQSTRPESRYHSPPGLPWVPSQLPPTP